ncbi:MAG TPA: bifunctional GNAT family N-acetyltransferase/acetate--CoA ligase family protein [Candidatus Dormibacteraeota bacterium]|jgi:acetyl coenzyme A synthetase (ADP forming)-like protein|nr:bifunctional GNAT family N-acetyltransferase/acetate--CoA ligase family protein [Candidatus Dormibacteraeota bacterium]
MAFVAVLQDDIVAVARYDRLVDGASAEVAFVVADAHQGRGLGTLLLECLAAYARAQGITQFVAETLTHNRRMLDVFHAAGFRDVRQSEHGVVTVTMEIIQTVESLAAVEERGWTAAVRSVRRLLRPRSVAVVGAGRDGGIGRAILDNVIAGGFQGPVYPVNPRSAQVAGLVAYPSVGDIDGDVDLAVLAVPARDVLQVVDDCATKGVRDLVIVTSGFGEMGDAGAAMERTVVEHAHRGGMRIVGPNCIGIVNTAAAVRLNATFIDSPPEPGHVAFASQSGALGIAMLEWSRGAGIGVSSFVSMGNKVDVSSNDLIRYWDQDSDTDVILLYLESFGNPRDFARIAPRVARHKPIVAVKAGRSAAGGRAAASHTASLATPDTAVDALFHQAGVIRVDDLRQLFEVGTLLATQPLPRGPRVGVVGNAGGAGILAADALDAARLTIPEFGPRLAETLRGAAPLVAGVSNPVDLGAGAGADAYRTALTAIAASGEVDALIAIHAPVRTVDTGAVAKAIASASASADIPVIATFLAMQEPPVPHADGRTVPSFAFVEPAAEALAAVVGYARWRERPPGVLPVLDGINADAARAVVASALDGHPDGCWMDADAAEALLHAYGIATAPSRLVGSASAAARAASEIGIPVALKVASGSIVHKTDVGGVQLGLRTAAEVRDAYAAMAQRLGGSMHSAIVQHMVPGGVELIIGVVQDPLFGPLIMFGSGGTAVEVFGDRAFRILPLTDVDAHELVESIRGAPLLHGHRGAPPVDIAAVEDALLRVAQLAADIPEVAEMDLNPVISSPSGAVVVDAKVRVMPWQDRPWLSVRHLRRAEPQHQQEPSVPRAQAEEHRS